ncbi:hypothetical protein [Catellatospora sichuanensis]|uniref:hypothetical protein n=1 Tax=Catellatospora sichuanensis TaxID=1969805 RepID=UPI00118456CB|nr:hypothetical protein [Catellatospora sichuanensis]
MTTYLHTLAVLLPELDGLAQPWVLSGSAAAALHGLDVTPGDIDLESTAPGAYEIGRRLARFQLTPVTDSGTDLVHSHFGRFLVGDMYVEVMGDLRIRVGDGWSAPFLAGQDPVHVQTAAGPVPVAARSALAGQYERLGRPDRAAPLRREHP